MINFIKRLLNEIDIIFTALPNGEAQEISKNLLKKNGVFVFEVHYLGKIIDEMQYDMIYHEHLYYYSLLSAIEHFNKYDLTIFDIKQYSYYTNNFEKDVSSKCNVYIITVPTPVDKKFKPDLVYYDVVYNPLETKMLKNFKKKQIITFNGLEMFLYQGQRSFSLWSKITPSVDEELKKEIISALN